MIVRPAHRQDTVVRPALLVDPSTAVQLDGGGRIPIKRTPATVRVFATWDTVDSYARQGEGELIAWGDEPIRWRHHRHGDSRRRRSDVVIIKLPVQSDNELADGLVRWADWLAGYQVNPGWSLGGTSMNLLRATLERPLVTTNGELPEPRWTLGGRQQCWLEPGTIIPGGLQLDLPAAYPTVVGKLRYGGSWRRVEAPALEQLELPHSHGWPVLARCHVTLPDGLQVGPLHDRPAHRPDSRVEEIAPTVPYPVSGTLEGIWTLPELLQAQDAGAAIRPLEAWIHSGGDTVFEDWHDAILEGRQLPGFAGLLAKATGSALWGQFVIDDRKQLQVQRWNGRYQALPVQGSSGHQRRAWDIGELVCGQVRARLNAALQLCADGLLMCHTDGLWVKDGYAAQVQRVLLEEQGWTVKTEAAALEILDQQKYRYRQPDGRSRVIFSGVPSGRAQETFAELWGRFGG